VRVKRARHSYVLEHQQEDEEQEHRAAEERRAWPHVIQDDTVAGEGEEHQDRE
jgi:hypothetical protein